MNILVLACFITQGTLSFLLSRQTTEQLLATSNYFVSQYVI